MSPPVALTTPPAPRRPTSSPGALALAGPLHYSLPRFGVVENLAARFSGGNPRKRRRRMALPLGGGGPGPAGAIGTGSFAVVMGPAGRDELDEVLIGPPVHLAKVPLHVVYTTEDAHPHNFTMQLMELRADTLPNGGSRTVVGMAANRHLPGDIALMPYNQICNPRNHGQIWAPTGPELTALQRDMQTASNHQHLVLVAREAGNVYPDILQTRPVRVAPPPPGAAVPPVGALPILPIAGAGIPPAAPPLLGAAAVAIPGGGPGAVGAPGPAVAGPVAGGGGPAPVVMGGVIDHELDVLKEVLEKMQLGHADLAERVDKKARKKKQRKASGSSSSAAKHKKKKKKKKKGKKDHKRFGIASSSESSSSSEEDSSLSSDDAKFLQWAVAGDGRKRKIAEGQLLRFQTLRFKKRGDLLTFATRFPGALIMHFLTQARAKAGLPPAKNIGALMETDLARWAEQSGLKEIWDQREVMFLARLISTIGARRIPEAMDLMAMRIREALLAKKEGQSWEKAAVVALTPGSLGPASPVPDAGLML